MQIQSSFGPSFNALKKVWKSPAYDPHHPVEKYGAEIGQRSTASALTGMAGGHGMARLQQPGPPAPARVIAAQFFGAYLYSIFKIS